MLDTDAMIASRQLKERDGNHIGAAAMYHKAAILGNSRDSLNSEDCSCTDWALKKDVNFASECFIKAAAGGLGDAYYSLGQIEEKGLEGESDGEKARSITTLVRNSEALSAETPIRTFSEALSLIPGEPKKEEKEEGR